MKELPRLQLANFSSSQFRTRLVIAVVLLNLMVIGLAFQSLDQGLKQSRARAAVATQNIAQLLEHDIAAAFDRIDLTLLALVDDLEDEPSGTSTHSIRAAVQHHFSRQPALDSLIVADATGTIIASGATHSSKPGLLADRPYFQQHKASAASGLVISPPLQSRLNGEWIITLSRRFNRPSGDFDGVLIGSIRLSHLRTLFSNIDLGPNGAVSLRDLDLGLVVRQPPLPVADAAVGSRTVSAAMRAAIEALPNPVSVPVRVDPRRTLADIGTDRQSDDPDRRAAT